MLERVTGFQDGAEDAPSKRVRTRAHTKALRQKIVAYVQQNMGRLSAERMDQMSRRLLFIQQYEVAHGLIQNQRVQIQRRHRYSLKK